MDYLWEWPDLAAEVGGLLEVEPDDALWPGDDTPPALPQHLHQLSVHLYAEMIVRQRQ